MKPISFRELERKLLGAGFFRAGQSGSHIKFVKTSDLETLVAMVPRHREVASGTLRSILRQAGISEKDFLKL